MSTNPLYNQLIERVLSERPELAPFAELLQQSQSSESDPPTRNTQELETRLKRLSSAMRRMKEDLDDALDVQEDLSKALGACHECWGEDHRCPTCRGNGQSGYFKPDRELFDRFILPAIRNAHWLEVKEKQ